MGWMITPLAAPAFQKDLTLDRVFRPEQPRPAAHFKTPSRT